MEYCANGDMTDKINNYRKEQETYDDGRSITMPEHKVMKFFIEVCEAVKYIHSKDIIHRDIKSPNIFITDDNFAKLGDFGLCIQGKTILTKTKYSTVGTDCYFSPESYKG
jgi:serine/threonine protein kinase